MNVVTVGKLLSQLILVYLRHQFIGDKLLIISHSYIGCNYMSYPVQIQSAKSLKLTANTTVFNQGDDCDQYVIVTSGSIKVFSRSFMGKEVVLYHISAGQMCVLTTSCLLANKSYPAQAITESDVELKIISKQQFDRYMNESTDFRAFVFSSFSERLSHLILLIEQLNLTSVEQRLSQYLLRASQSELTINTTHQAVATEIGSAREVVSRHLKELERKNVLTLGRTKITIVDVDSLTNMATFSHVL
ncbi:MAG: Crp/Fnr family transcriptional regulator [Gammaproteobacteria bacterium]|nr:Crp/Fnr family transcriptional regulator [Gammaproteobacteria bacterium]